MDEVVLVVAADETDVRAPVQLRDDLEAVGARCAGLFFNRVQIDAPGFLRGADSVTAVVAQFPGTRAKRASRAQGERWSRTEICAFAAAVFMLLIYSQGWELPLVGGGDETAHSALLRNLFLPAYAVGIFLAGADAARPRARAGPPAVPDRAWSASRRSPGSGRSRRTRPRGASSRSPSRPWAAWCWPRATPGRGWPRSLAASLRDPGGGVAVHRPLRAVDRADGATSSPGSWRGLWLEKNAFGGNMADGRGDLRRRRVAQPAARAGSGGRVGAAVVRAWC